MDIKPKRRWFRFSLRTLLVFVTIASAGFGWLGVKVRHVQGQREAVEAIERVGGRVEYQRAEVPGPAWLRRLLGDDFFIKPRYVGFSPDRTSDSDLSVLEKLDEIQSIGLWGSNITDSGMSHLHDLMELRFLSLIGTAVTDSGLKHLERLPKLTALSITNSRITDQGLASVIKLNDLENLSLFDTDVTDSGIASLVALKRLKHLTLIGTRVTSAGVSSLKQSLPDLRVICSTEQTDLGLRSKGRTNEHSAERFDTLGRSVFPDALHSRGQQRRAAPERVLEK